MPESLVFPLAVSSFNSLKKVSLAALTVVSMFLKMRSSLAVHIAQHIRMAINMKICGCDCALICSSASGNIESWLKLMLSSLQQLLAKGHSRNKCYIVSSELT